VSCMLGDCVRPASHSGPCCGLIEVLQAQRAGIVEFVRALSRVARGENKGVASDIIGDMLNGVADNIADCGDLIENFEDEVKAIQRIKNGGEVS
jgi:hypothetical protein